MRATEPFLTEPFLTVAVTTYNRADLLIGALESVLSQNFNDYELLIIDDASPDHTEQVAREFIAQSANLAHAPAMRYLRQPTNQGVDAARNLAIEEARGEFIVYLDDDDRFAPDFLHHVQRALRHAPDSVAFAVSGRRMISLLPTGESTISRLTFGYQTTVHLAGEQYIQNVIGGGAGLVVRLNAARAAGGWHVGFQSGGDTDFMIRLATRWDFLIIPEATLIIHNMARPQITHSRMNNGIAHERLADRYADALSRFPMERIRHYRRAARMYFAAKAHPQARRCLWKALRIRPFSYKTWGLWLLLELNPLLPVRVRRKLLSHPRHGYHPS